MHSIGQLTGVYQTFSGWVLVPGEIPEVVLVDLAWRTDEPFIVPEILKKGLPLARFTEGLVFKGTGNGGV